MSILNMIEWSELRPISHPASEYDGYNPGTTILKAGYVYEEGRRPFAVDTLLNRDVPVKMRDGITIYIDIYRPVDSDINTVPAILSWGCAGKRGMNNMLDHFGLPPSESDFVGYAEWVGRGKTTSRTMPTPHLAPYRMGIPMDQLSGLQAWECQDPAYWVAKGYAIVNADARGAYMSEGDIRFFGSLDAEDTYDTIEFIGVQPWCNGKVGMAGCSWYAMTQWCVSAIHPNPPHLAAIAPWEGEGDLYRDEYMRGGIPSLLTPGNSGRSFGSGSIEDIVKMMEKYPYYNEYWEDKAWDWSKITVPVYEVASYSSQMHAFGALDGFRRIASKDKWLRIHNKQEWVDAYNPANMDDLCKFFDYYLKGIENGWKDTPTVRMSILDPGGTDLINLPEETFPPARVQYRTLYLDNHTMSLSDIPIQEVASVSYETDELDCKVSYIMEFQEDTKVVGFPSIKLWVECQGYDDMDLFVRIIKTDKNGTVLYQDSICYLYAGTDCRLRVSLRELDLDRSTPYEPVLSFRHPRKLKVGEIVPVEIPFWPTGMIFHKGEKLQLIVAGYDYMPNYPFDRPVPSFENHGRHIIHCGGLYDSCIHLPILLD